MQAQTAEPLEVSNARPPAFSELPVLVVGSGPVGIRATQELHRLAPERPLVLFGAEPWAPYNRVRLSALLAGQSGAEELDLSASLPQSEHLLTRFNVPVLRIDRPARQVEDAEGQRYPYRALILATGSRPYIPPIPGIEIPGVFTFRDMTDAERLQARLARSRRTVVLGGGLLGLETARAMARFNTRITVVEHNDHLMFNQLDPTAASLLRRDVQGLGIRVICGQGVRQVLGVSGLEAVVLRSGEELACDTLVVAAGIRPNLDLARDAGLKTRQGILVDDGLRTSDPAIYAVGECAEHRGQVYGLVAPGFEQAAVAAHRIRGRSAQYLGTLSAASLKLAQRAVFSLGQVQDTAWPRVSRVFEDPEQGVYRKLILRRGRLCGALGVGDWPERHRLQEALLHGRRIWPWQLLRFCSQGLLWPEEQDLEIHAWPADATVCNCTGVSLSRLRSAMAAGAASPAALTEATAAGSVCGSCKPQLAALCGQARPDPVAGWKGLGAWALGALLLCLAVLLAPVIPYHGSVQPALAWDWLWRDSLAKQVTGFSLLGLGVLLSMLSLRKRLPRFSWGSFDGWRWLHGAMGLLAVLALVAHTGLRLGHQLNFWLMLCFVLLLLAGTLAGGAIAWAHRLPQRAVIKARRLALSAHIWLLWPLPALLGYHLLKTYYF